MDVTTSAELASARGTAEVRGSFEEPESQAWVVSAPGFALDVPHPAFTSWREPATMRVVADGTEHDETFDACDAYALMVDAVSDRAAGGDAWVLPLDTSLAVATVVDRVREASAT